MILATTLILQSNPFSLVQATSNSQDANQLSAFSPSSAPSSSSLVVQAVLECLSAYQSALQGQVQEEELFALRSEAMGALEYLDNAAFWPNASEMESLIQMIGSIRQLDADFPIYQPHKVSWPKRSEMPAQPSFSLTSSIPFSLEPSLSLLEASHDVECASLQESSVVKRSVVSTPKKGEAPTLNQDPLSQEEPSFASSQEGNQDLTLSSSASHSSLEEPDGIPTSQGFVELPSQDSLPESDSSFSSAFEDPSFEPIDSPSLEEPSLQEVQTPSDSLFISQEPASLTSSDLAVPPEISTSSDGAVPLLSADPTAVVVIEASRFDPRITADLKEGPALPLNQQSEEAISSISSMEEMPVSDTSNSSSSLYPNGFIQTIDPIIEEPTSSLDSSVEEMPVDEGFIAGIEETITEESDSKLDSASSQEADPVPPVSPPAPSVQVQPAFMPTPTPKQETVVEAPIEQPLQTPVVVEPPMEMMEEEPDLASMDSVTFSIFDYVSKSSSLLELVYPGLGIGPMPILNVAALPVATQDHLNQNPKNFKDSDDISAEGRPYIPPRDQSEEMNSDDLEVLGIPEGQEDFEEIPSEDQRKNQEQDQGPKQDDNHQDQDFGLNAPVANGDPTLSENLDQDIKPEELPQLPQSPEDPKDKDFNSSTEDNQDSKPSQKDDSTLSQEDPSQNGTDQKPSDSSKPMEDSKNPSEPTIVDISNDHLAFDVMPDFDPSIIAPAPANPFLPGSVEQPMDNISPSNQEQMVNAWASVPPVSTPTLSQSIKVRQLTKKENRRLKIGDLGFITLLPNYTDSFAWKKAASPYNTPLLWGQCTWFAWGRFYDLYGYSPGFSGNGYECVSQLLSVHGDKFSLSSKPASGAVFSSDVAHNHVGIVLEYDEEKDLLTIQEGNLDGISNSNWDEAVEDYRTLRLSSSDMRTLYGNVTYAVPKKNTKFVGYEETKTALSKKETSQINSKKGSKDLSGINLNSLRSVCFDKLKSFLFIWEEMEEVPSSNKTEQTDKETKEIKDKEESQEDDWKDDDFLSMDDL